MDRDRFDRFVIPEPNSGCWLWLGATANGYGMFSLGKNKLGRAHRIAWCFAYGDVSEEAQVLHRCDTPCCVNPDHLFLGTRSDNMIDMIKKGRHLGTRRKLTFEQVAAIRADTRRQADIALDYGVDQSTISNVKRRYSYNWT
jgi:hypothetical protein